MIKRMRTISLLLLLLCLGLSSGFQLVAHVSQNGVKGSITFSQNSGDPNVSVTVNATVSDESSAGEYSWGVYEFPIDYSVSDFCHSRMLGRKPVLNFDDTLGKVVLAANESNVLEFTANDLPLLEKSDSLWGRSLVLEGPSKQRICATLTPVVDDTAAVKVAEARFTSPLAGSVWFTSLSKREGAETKIHTNLYHVSGKGAKSSQHLWQIFITDILDKESDKKGGNCDFLQIVYDPDNKGEGCSESSPENCRQGDLSGKFGVARVGNAEGMFSKGYHTDLNLELPELGGGRSLYLVLFDQEHPDSFLACAKIRNVKPKVARANFMSEGISGNITFSQRSPFHPVVTSLDLRGLHEGAGGYHVHEFPVPAKRDEKDTPCARTAGHFNPFSADPSVSPPPGVGSGDKYEVGDLAGKYGSLKELNRVRERYVDPNLSLFGRYSVVGRSIVIHRSPVPNRWVCANIESEDEELLTAVAQFTYPVAGRIVFRQNANDPFADTTVFVESLLYSDGTKNDTTEHPWHVHVDIPGKDYFNWTGRCLSAGGHFNPYQVSMEESDYSECINEHGAYKCELGDLVNKLGSLSVAGRKKGIATTVKFFTDSNLPLTGPAGIIGHSLVIHDEHAPEHRGNRMACTAIQRQFRHKAVASEWFGNGVTPPPLSGSKLEFLQDTELGISHSLVDLKGLKGQAEAYHIHDIPVQEHLEFPCTGDAVGDHYNPFKYDKSESPKENGTPDQYEIGDLSGKYGSIPAGAEDVRGVYNDSNLPLYGSHSIVGRSIVVHKKTKAERWACASIGWGFDPDEAKEVKAIASFHHPGGFAWGYIKFSQVVYRDGSSTDTTITVRLKYPGKTNKELTANHDWSVYVNPVSFDASVKFFNARCTAAGYRWNPTLIQLANPQDKGFYGEECGRDYPLRCEVGDLSGRHGKISIGGKAYVFNDVNLPLHGDWFQSAIGKSIVVHNPEGDGERMACANIEEDKNIVKFATIRTQARFNLATFIEEVQAVMGVPEWFLFVDSRNTEEVHGGKCIRIQLHFAGPKANKLEQDFNRLLRTGKQETPSIDIPGFIPDPERKTTLGYRECGTDKPSSSSSTSSINDLYFSLTSGGATAAGMLSQSLICCSSLLVLLELTRWW